MKTLEALDDSRSRYEAWVNNRVMALLMSIEVNRLRDSRSLLKHEFFLEEIEHHFMKCHAGRRVWNAFRYLKRYLTSYPQNKIKHRQRALEMLGLVYEALGFEKWRISGNGYGTLRRDIRNYERKDEIAVLAGTIS